MAMVKDGSTGLLFIPVSCSAGSKKTDGSSIEVFYYKVDINPACTYEEEVIEKFDVKPDITTARFYPFDLVDRKPTEHIVLICNILECSSKLSGICSQYFDRITDTSGTTDACKPGSVDQSPIGKRKRRDAGLESFPKTRELQFTYSIVYPYKTDSNVESSAYHVTISLAVGVFALFLSQLF